MTTIIYKNGVLYADSQRSEVNARGDILSVEEIEKIHVFHHFMYAGAGLAGVIDMFNSYIHRTFFNMFGWTIGWLNVQRKIVENYGDTNIIYCTSDSVEVRYIDYEHIFLSFYRIKLRETEKYKTKNIWIIFGSGSNYFTDKDIENPSETIAALSKLDKYTNDKISFYDSKELSKHAE